jgi:hypothetical protein
MLISVTTRLVVLSAALALVVVHETSAYADKKAKAAPAVRVGVVPGIAVNLDAAKVDALSQDLAEALSSELEVSAVGGLDVRRALPADGVAADCIAQPSCVADVAKRLDVQQLLFVVMVDTGGSVQVDTTWVDPATGHTAARPAIDLATIGNARARFATLAHELLPDAAVRAKPSTGGNSDLRTTDGKPRHITTPAIITAGVAVAGLGIAIGFGLDTRSHYNTCESTDCTQSSKDSIRHTGVIADAGLLLAIGGAIAASVLYSTSSEEPHLIVAPTPGGVAFATGWSF